MKKILYITLPIVMLFSFNSCDWFNVTFLGKPSQAELELERLNSEKARQDSLNRLIAAQELVAQQQEAQQIATTTTLTGERYHIVMGCFKVPENADRMGTLLQKKGYQPQRINLKNGFTCLSAFSSNSLNAALEEMYKIMQQDFAPNDIWIYDSKDELHK